jgi:hypothetical protein
LNALIANFRIKYDDHLDADAKATLDRLAKDDFPAQDVSAAQAFHDFKVNDEDAESILIGCIEADLLARTFNDRLADASAMLRLSEGCDDALRKLRDLVSKTLSGPFDRLTARVVLEPEDCEAIARSLDLLARVVAAQRRIARETVTRLGATQKTKGDAAVTAAIGWIAEAVRRNCRRPHDRAAADLAAVVLCCEVSTDRLREARRTRETRDWRLPIEAELPGIPPSKVGRSGRKKPRNEP